MKTIFSTVLFILSTLFSITYAQQVIILRDSTEVPELQLEEIRVQASKSNLSLKKMPASVTLLSARRINENEVQSLTDLTSLTPGFFMPDYGSRLTSPVYIRGIGSRINSPSVGLYVDNVPYYEKASYNFDFFDIERIEILKGPQGTLYGRNAMGGIINIVTSSPLDTRGTRLGITAGAFGKYEATAGHHGAIGENAGYSLSASYRHLDGYHTNNYTGRQVDRSNSAGMRNRLAWRPTVNLKIENIASFELSREGGYPYAMITNPADLPVEINYNQPSGYERSIFSDALIVQYEGRGFELQSTTAYQYLDDLQEIDQDFTPDSAYFVVQDQVHHMVSQEWIARSKADSRINWLFGAYGFYQDLDKQVDVDVYASNMRLTKIYENSVMGAALFHQSTFNDLIVDGLSLTAGIRFDAEQDILDYHYDRAVGENVSNITDTIYPYLRYIEILPKIALNYAVGNSSFYGVIAKGYKTGGFNSTFYRDEDLFYLPEQSWNYEIGTKMALFNNHVYADISLFYIDWVNQQIYQPAMFPDGSLAPGSNLKNAGRSVSKGGELTIKTTKVSGISPVFSYGYTHAIFTEHMADAETDYSGNFIPYIPKHTVTLQLGRSFRTDGTDMLDRIRLNVLYRGQGEIWWNEENTFRTDYYNLLDLKASFEKAGFSLEFWGKNLLGTNYESFYFQAIGNEYVQLGKPFRFGLNLNYEF